jgi:ATP-dependent RNA helicase DHX57
VIYVNDPETNLSRLVEVWVTRAGARQRRGRAGRTQPGICYRLYTRRQEKGLAEFPIPEILRVPLESVSLSVKASKEDQDVKVCFPYALMLSSSLPSSLQAFLSQAIEAPSLASMDRAWETLVEIGAVDSNDHLTALGKHMVSQKPICYTFEGHNCLQVFVTDGCQTCQGLTCIFNSSTKKDAQFSQMLILGTIFRCLGPIVTVVALLSSKPLFLNPLERRDEARAYVTCQSVKFISYRVSLVPEKSSLQRTVTFLPTSRPSMNV